MRVPILLAAASLAACAGEGSFELVLSLPSDPDLRPTGMTTVTVVLTEEGEQPIATTSVLDNDRFSTGDLALANNVRVAVQLRDVANRLVGVGEAAEPIDIVADQQTVVELPVRRPFVYASNGSALFSFDPTLEPTDSRFQGQIDGVAVPQVVVSVGGDRLAIVGSSSVGVLATDTHQLVGTPIVLPGITRDAAAVPGTSKLAIAHDQGIAIVDLDTGEVANTPAGPVDRVTVGPSGDGRMLAHGLVGRLMPGINPLETCSGSSSIVTIDVAAPGQEVAPRPLPQPASDLAAAPENVGLFATLPCSGQVVRVEASPDGTGVTFAEVAALERASVVVVSGGRVYAAGTRASEPHCINPLGQDVTCQASSPTLCPPPGAPPPSSVDYVTEGARMVVLSIPLDGGMPITLELPARRETVFDDDDPAKQHAQVLQAFGAVPVDLVALPGGQFVGLVATSNYYIQQLSQGANVILPCLDATTADWLLLDLASSSISQRVRTTCDLVVGPADDFPDWKCDVPPLGERSAFGDYVPISVGALFGAR